MKTLIVAAAFATVAAAPAFAQSANAWAWNKGASAAPASAASAYAYAPSSNGSRIVLPGRTVGTYARNCNVSPASPAYRGNCH